ncbi:MAG: hypothetical protein IT473_16010 [Lysobacter sp.]|nr:hypothetical protein [Lysobacter sp.]
MACSAHRTPAEQAQRSLKIGENYGEARSRLLSAGWRPVRAQCSERNVCFREWPEMTTRLSDAQTCGVLIAEGDKLMICIRPIADGANIAFIETLY